MKRSIGFAVLCLLLFSGSAFAFGKNKIVYKDFKWNIYHSTHFDVYFYNEEKDALQKVVNFAESAYDDLSRKFNFQISKKIPLIYYATHSDFEQTNVILMFIPEGIGAFAEPARNRMVLPIDMADEKLLQLIQHELTHIFEYEILFQGRLGKELTTNPPTWIMEGLASFMAQDEDSRDRMVLRDAVVNDNVPSVTTGFGGYFAYRFGHAVFRFIVEKYGWDGLRDFIYEYRNTLGSSLDKPLKRSFELTVEEFDTKFRTWLRKQYLPALVTKGEPQEYGDPFKLEQGSSQEISPVPAPSGDLMVALTTHRDDVDIALFNVPERKMIRSLTDGFSDEYEYIIAQLLTTGPVAGRDLAFNPNGDQVAVFVKKERGRNLLILNSLSGELERSISMKVEQQLNPTFSPDGTRVVFHGFTGNRADIFEYDLVASKLTNITDDEFFDGSPTYSPDGKWIVYSSVVNGYSKLFRLDRDNPSRRFQLTQGEWNDVDASFSPDGKRIFFASDRMTGREEAKAVGEMVAAVEKIEAEEKKAGRDTDTPPPDPANFAAYNIYSLELEKGRILQYTDVVGGCFTPSVFVGTGNKERLMFSSYYKGNWSLYTTTTDNYLKVADTVAIPTEPMLAENRGGFVPPVEVAIDEEKIENYGGFKLFVDDVQVQAGVNSDNTFVSRSVIFMSDMLGNRRFIASLDSVSTFSNFDFLYLDMRTRMNWGFRLFDDRSYFVAANFQTGNFERIRRLYRQTGAIGLISYPFDRYHRLDVGAGWMLRDIDYPIQVGGGQIFLPRTDNFPLVSGTYTGDSAIFKSFGPISGRRYEFSTTYAVDMEQSGTLTSDITMDFRQYFQLTSRSLLAFRLFAGMSDGNAPSLYYFGGLNTIRGLDFRSIVGDRAAFANFEFRFPLIDALITPIIRLGNIRGNIFFDIGGAKFADQPDYQFFENGRLINGVASVGWGVSVVLFGLEMHWDFAQLTDLKDFDTQGFRTSFWIGDPF